MASLHWPLPYMVRCLCLTHLQWKMMVFPNVGWLVVLYYSALMCSMLPAACWDASTICGVLWVLLWGPTSNETLHSWPYIYITGKRITSKDASFFTAVHEAHILTPKSASTQRKKASTALCSHNKGDQISQNWGQNCSVQEGHQAHGSLFTLIGLSWDMSDICSYIRKNFTRERPGKFWHISGVNQSL